MYILWETYAQEREILCIFFGLVLFVFIFYVKQYFYKQAHTESATTGHCKALILNVLLYTSSDPCFFVYQIIVANLITFSYQKQGNSVSLFSSKNMYLNNSILAEICLELRLFLGPLAFFPF